MAYGGGSKTGCGSCFDGSFILFLILILLVCSYPYFGGGGCYSAEK